MNGNTKFEEAVEFAVRAHHGQTRKSENVPFILHPMEVASIIATMTTNTDVLIAGLLHDTIEDTFVTGERIERKFGSRIRKLVESETEDKMDDVPKEESWKIRKQKSLDDLASETNIDVKIMWMGDKLSNMRSFYRSYLKEGDKLWEHFHQKDPKEQRWYYESIKELLVDLKDTGAYKEYCWLFDIVFKNVTPEVKNEK